MTRRRLAPLLLALLVGALLAGCEPPTGILWGQLTIEGTDDPAPGTSVFVFAPDSFTVVARTAADSNGRYSFDPATLPPGTYRLRFSAQDWWDGAASWAASSNITVTAGGSLQIDAEVTPVVGGIRGVTRHEDAPIGGVTIEARSVYTGAVIASTTSAPDGTWSFAGLAFGRYHIRFSGPGIATLYWNGGPNRPGVGNFVQVTAGAVTNLGPGNMGYESTISGSVVDGDDPAPGIVVVAIGEDGGIHGITATAADGSFSFGGLWLGEHFSGQWLGEYRLALFDITGTHPAVVVNRAGPTTAPRVFQVVFDGDVPVGPIDVATGEVVVQPYTAIAAGDLNTCAIGLDQALTCWGNASTGMTAPPPGTFTAVTLGSTHACALATDQTIQCWGQDHDEQASPPPGTYTQIDSDGAALHTCAIATDQTIDCWGFDILGSTTPSPGTYLDVSVGPNHTCGLATDLTFECWGLIGIDDPITGTYTAIASGADNDYVCAIDTDQALECWGYVNPYLLDPPEGSYTALAAGSGQACAIDTDQSITCWGAGDVGGFDPPPGNYVAISAGTYHMCAITTDDVAVCFGRDDFGQSTPL